MMMGNRISFQAVSFQGHEKIQTGMKPHGRKCYSYCVMISDLNCCFKVKKDVHEIIPTSSYPGWIKSPHVVTLGILKISDFDSLTIFIGGGIPE